MSRRRAHAVLLGTLLLGASCATPGSPTNPAPREAEPAEASQSASDRAEVADPGWSRHFDRAAFAHERADFRTSVREARTALRLLADDPRHRRDRALVERLLGQSLYRLGRYREAEPVQQRVLAYRQQAFGMRSPEAGVASQDLAALYLKSGHLEKARAFNGRAIEALATVPSAGVHYASCLNTRAYLHRHGGRWDAAEADLRTGLQILQRFGRAGVKLVPILQNGLGQTLEQSGDPEGAEAMYRMAILGTLRMGGQRDPHLGLFTRDLATFKQSRGELVEAEELLRAAVEQSASALGRNHPEVRASLLALAALLEATGRLDEAAAQRRRATMIRPAF